MSTACVLFKGSLIIENFNYFDNVKNLKSKITKYFLHYRNNISIVGKGKTILALRSNLFSPG